MKKIVLVLVLVSLIPVSILAGVLLIDWEEAEEKVRLYTYPLLVEDETYVVTVRTNYSSVPEVGYYGIASLYSVTVDFRGEKENSFCNITVPTDLISGDISVIDKYYEMTVDRYTLSNNGTHNSVYFPFNHPALVKHFEIKGTEGIPYLPTE